MKETINVAKNLIILLPFFVILILVSCPMTLRRQPVVFTGSVFADAFSPIIRDPLYWEGDNGFRSGDESTIVRNGRTSHFLDWSGISSPGFNGFAINAQSTLSMDLSPNLSQYNALTFWARSETETVTVNGIGFGASSASPTYEIRLNNVDITANSSWQKFILPIPNPEKLTSVENIFYAVDAVPSGRIYLDDIQFESLDNITISRFSAPEMISVNVGSTTNIENVEVDFTVGTDAINFVELDGNDSGFAAANIVHYVDWESANEDMVTVSNTGVISGRGATSVPVAVTGTLGTQTVTIMVTVREPPQFTGPVYNDSLQMGFTFASAFDTSSNATGGTSDSNETSVRVGASGSSIRITLNSADGDNPAPMWGGGFINTGGINVSNNTNLVFDLNVASITGIGYLELQVEDSASNSSDANTLHRSNILSRTGVAVSGSAGWETYTIPLSEILQGDSNLVDRRDYTSIGFWHPSMDNGSGGRGTILSGTYYIDNIRFTN